MIERPTRPLSVCSSLGRNDSLRVSVFAVWAWIVVVVVFFLSAYWPRTVAVVWVHRCWRALRAHWSVRCQAGCFILVRAAFPFFRSQCWTCLGFPVDARAVRRAFAGAAAVRSASWPMYQPRPITGFDGRVVFLLVAQSLSYVSVADGISTCFFVLCGSLFASAFSCMCCGSS